MRARAISTAVIAAAGVLVASVTPAAHAQTLSDLARATGSHQLIIVQARSPHSSRGTLQAWTRTADGWRPEQASTDVRLGAHGVVAAARRRQDTMTTPAGTFTITSAFGRLPDPGTALPYRHLTAVDAWTYDPRDASTYNLFQSAPVTWAGYGQNVEHLRAHGRQYDFVAVIDYNTPPGPVVVGSDGIARAAHPANTAAGGGIFLHVSDGTATEGCIAVAKPVMVKLLRWMNPAEHPLIVIAASSQQVTTS